MNTQFIHFRQLAIIVGLLVMVGARAPAQGPEEQRSPISMSGIASLGLDVYEVAGSAGWTAQQRRPNALLRLVANPTIAFGEQWSLPFTIILTTPETSTTRPVPRSANLGDFVGNPANCLSVAPKFGWAQINLGTQTPSLSELSGGNIQLFGAGVDLAPGNFRFIGSAGAVGRSAAADTALGMSGAYARQAYMGRLAYVNDRTEIGLNVVRIRDDGASIPTVWARKMIRLDPVDPSSIDTVAAPDALMPLPQESFTATLNARVPITENVGLRAEAGGSLFTRDMNAGEIAEPAGEIRPLMAQRLSTRADLAGKLTVEIERGNWGATLSSTYIGPGYRTLAYPWMQADRLDATLAPHLGLLDDDLQLSGSIGWQQNNLSGTEEATTSQLLGSAAVTARLSDALAINAQYSNYGLRTPVRNDTFRVETVSRSIGISPVVTLATDAVTHVMTASLGIDDYTDYNPITGAAGTNRTRSISGGYSVALSAVPLSVDVAGSWLVNQLSVGDLTITSGSIGAGYRLFNGAVTLGAGCSFTRTALEAEAADESLAVRLNTAVRITDALRFRADASITHYDYGDSRPGASFNERLLRTSLEWRW